METCVLAEASMRELAPPAICDRFTNGLFVWVVGNHASQEPLCGMIAPVVSSYCTASMGGGAHRRTLRTRALLPKSASQSAGVGATLRKTGFQPGWRVRVCVCHWACSAGTQAD